MNIETWQPTRAKSAEFLAGNSYHLGHVFCSSGFYRSIINSNGERQLMDWALIEVATKRLAN